MTAAGNPTVFIIDADAAVRAAIQGLLKSVVLRAELAEMAEAAVDHLGELAGWLFFRLAW